MTSEWNITLQFYVRKGPSAFVSFRKGHCTVGRGKARQTDCCLYFLSPNHLNKMFDGSSIPIILKGFTKLRFLLHDFNKITERLEYFLKPTNSLLDNKDYLAMNTQLTMTTAAFSVPELGILDSVAVHPASHIRNGTILMKVDNNPIAVHISFNNGAIIAH